MNRTTGEIRSYYAARAPEYDAIYTRPGRQSDLRSLERWLPSFFRDANVLEVACGTGYWTQFIAQVAARVVAIDASPETMAIAKARVAEARVDFQVGDAYALSSELGPFDAAFAGFWFSHIPKARRHDFLRSLDGLLTPGARVVLIDNLYVHGGSAPIAEADGDGNTYQIRRLKDGSSYRVLKNFPTGAELHSALGGLGKDAKFTVWEHYWAFEYVAWGPRNA